MVVGPGGTTLAGSYLGPISRVMDTFSPMIQTILDLSMLGLETTLGS